MKEILIEIVKSLQKVAVVILKDIYYNLKDKLVRK